MESTHIVKKYNIHDKNDYMFNEWFEKYEQHLVNMFEIFKNDFHNEVFQKKITFDNFCCFIFEQSSTTL